VTNAQNVLKIYKEQYGVSASAVTVPSDYYSVTETRFLAGKPPFDVLDFDPGFMGKFVKNKWIVDLEGLPGVDKLKQDMYPGALSACSLNGKLYALPLYTNVNAMFYNEDILSKQGLKPAQDWDELYEQAVHMKQNGVPSPVIPTWTTKFNLTRQSFVNDCVSRGMNSQFDSSLNPLWDKDPIALDVVNYWKKLLDAHLVPPDALTIDHHQSSSVMQAGRGAYFWFASYEIQNLNKVGTSAAAGKIRAMLMPGKTHGAITGTSPVFMSTRNNREGVWPLMNFLSGLDKDGKYTGPIQREAIGEALLLGYKPTANDPEIAKAWSAFTTSADLEVFAKQLQLAAGDGDVLNETWYSDYADSMTKTLSKFLAGQISGSEALKTSADQTRQLKAKAS